MCVDSGWNGNTESLGWKWENLPPHQKPPPEKHWFTCLTERETLIKQTVFQAIFNVHHPSVYENVLLSLKYTYFCNKSINILDGNPILSLSSICQGLLNHIMEALSRHISQWPTNFFLLWLFLMYFWEEKALINLFTTFSGNYVSFIMFNSGNNFSNPRPLFLESESSPREPSAESSLRLLLKKLLGFGGFFCKWNIIKCITWKGANLSFRDCRMFPCDDFYYGL